MPAVKKVTRSSAGGVEALASKRNEKKELDSRLRGNDRLGLPAPPQEEWKPWFETQQPEQELDSRLRGNDDPGELPAPPQEEWKPWF